MLVFLPVELVLIFYPSQSSLSAVLKDHRGYFAGVSFRGDQFIELIDWFRVAAAAAAEGLGYRHPIIHWTTSPETLMLIHFFSILKDLPTTRKSKASLLPPALVFVSPSKENRQTFATHAHITTTVRIVLLNLFSTTRRLHWLLLLFVCCLNTLRPLPFCLATLLLLFLVDTHAALITHVHLFCLWPPTLSFFLTKQRI